MAESHFDDWVAERYEQLWPQLFAPEVLGPTLDCLDELARGGACLEFGIGTGRIGIPLSRRGIRVQGIELAQSMVRKLHAQPGGKHLAVTIGDFATTFLGGGFSLVYLLRNTITNLTTQEEQYACFRNAADHLAPEGLFLIENYVPQLQHLPPGETVRVFAAEPDHLAFEDYDSAAQIAVSTHYWVIDGELRRFCSPHRYVWPHELDLMAKNAGLTLLHRWSDWHRKAFTSDSPSHISVWRKPAEVGGHAKRKYRRTMEIINLGKADGLPPVDWAGIVEKLDAGSAPAPDAHNARTTWLSTINSDGSPHVTAVGALWLDGAFWFQTGTGTRKGRNVARDRRCSVAVSIRDADVVIEGDATRVTDPAAIARIAKAWADNGWPAEPDESGSGITAPFNAPSLGPPPWNVYRIEPRSATVALSAEPGGLTRFRF